MGAMTFGERLRAMREAKGWSRRHLGYLIDRSESTIKNWETDEDEPNMESLRALAQQHVLGPESIAAAFEDVAALTWPDDDSTEQATARYLGFPDWGMAEQAPDLVLSPAG